MIRDATDPMSGGGEPAILQRSGRLGLPVGRSGRSPAGPPLPVSLGNDEWGVIWPTAAPPDGIQGEWPNDQYTEMWFATRETAEWSEPRLLLGARLGLEWSDLTIRYSARGAPLLLVIREESVLDRDVMFGPLAGPLAPIPLSDELRPHTAALYAGDGLIAVAIQLSERDSNQSWLQIITSQDDGTTWSDPEVVWRTSGIGRGLRLHRDEEGVLHLFWVEGFTGLRHVRGEAGDWTEVSAVPVPDSEVLFGSVTGVDRCGSLALAQEVLTSSGEVGFKLWRWVGTGWVRDDLLDGLSGLNLFDGVSEAGAWHLGLSGALDSEGAATAALALWTVTP